MANLNSNRKPVAIITGANAGIGQATATALAQQGYHLFLACRSEEKTKPVLEQIKASSGNPDVEFIKLDLASLKSVREAANTFAQTNLPLDRLVNNAGMAVEKGLTADGFDLLHGTNHLGPFLFTVLLLPHIRRAAQETGDARIVHVASEAHYKPKQLNWDMFRRPASSIGAFTEYGSSKLCNVMFSNELARRLEGTNITSNSLHPGVVASDIWRHAPNFLRWLSKPFILTNEQGARTSLYLTTSPEVKGVSGKYFDSCKEKAPNPLALDANLCRELWDRSVQWTQLTPEETRAAGLQ